MPTARRSESAGATELAKHAVAHALDSEGAPAVAAIVRLVDAVEPMAEETQTLDLSYLQANVETMGLTELQAAQAALEASAPVPSAGDQGVDVTA